MTGDQVSPPPLEGRIVVISPHPDDAVLSLGATIATATRAGHSVRVVTVFAGDEAATVEAGPWDSKSGFRSAAEAARARALEDDEACRIVGAEPVRLPYLDKDYERVLVEEEILRVIVDAVGESDVVLIPAFPLANEDHAWLSTLLLAGLRVDARIALYAEQPYAAWAHEVPAAAQPDREWHAIKAPALAQAAKLRACRAYKSQIPMLGGMRVVFGILSYEAQLGGESISWSAA
ncbi:MAG: PIG-L family deacetylase [Actinomycetota bacterium]|nr:PIG-L family deacetylase [Actinomycetota bacterium]